MSVESTKITESLAIFEQLKNRKITFEDEIEIDGAIERDTIKKAKLPTIIIDMIDKIKESYILDTSGVIITPGTELYYAEQELMEMNLLKEESDYKRLAPLYLLAKKIYSNIPSEDEYTQKADGESENQRGHYYIVANSLTKPSDITTATAAFFHDIERFFESSKVPYFDIDKLDLLGGKSLDSTLRKKAAHPESSAQVTLFLLDQFELLRKNEINEIKTLIQYHDAGSKGLVLNINECGDKLEILPPLKSEDILLNKVSDLSEADAVAFFDATFIIFAKKYWDKAEKSQNNDERNNKILELNDRIKLCYDKLKTLEGTEKAIILAQNKIDFLPDDGFKELLQYYLQLMRQHRESIIEKTIASTLEEEQNANNNDIMTEELISTIEGTLTPEDGNTTDSSNSSRSRTTPSPK